MDADLSFVLGIVFALLAFPALVSAFSESRPPRAALILIVISAGLIVYASQQNPGGYSIDEAPDIIFGVIADLVN